MFAFKFPIQKLRGITLYNYFGDIANSIAITSRITIDTTMHTPPVNIHVISNPEKIIKLS
ncbi:hypothetical protein SDC9_185918 [bioreactor metagenome]|uniref:Uncharacterized protein n=1 Tax=bioreactor metagenome TaxID=1076179 RepID=A0A645HQI4_9ZZZZ